jgi:Uma2 family endonuclease
MATVETLLTAEEYGLLPDEGQPTELVRGRVVPRAFTTPRRGYHCAEVVCILGEFVEEHDLGRVCNNFGVVTERDPDTVRAADVAYYSFDRLPRGPLPEGYAEVAPDVVFEIRSPSDRWAHTHAKVSEYLNAGVQVVCVHDVQSRTLLLYRPDEVPVLLEEPGELALPEVHADFRAPVARLFE